MDVEVDHGVAQRPPHVELQRQVVDALGSRWNHLQRARNEFPNEMVQWKRGKKV
jgi:hypothetical protein